VALKYPQAYIPQVGDLLKALSSKGFSSYSKIYNLVTLDAKTHSVDILARLSQSCSQPNRWPVCGRHVNLRDRTKLVQANLCNLYLERILK
jgi:hypothetical protein